MKKSAYYSDLFFAFSLSAFCALFVLRFFGLKLLLALFPSVIFGLLCAFALSIRLRNKQRVFALKKSEEQEKENLCFYLRLAEPTEIKRFLDSRLSLLVHKLREDFEAPSIENPVAPAGTIECEGFYFYPLFLFRELTPDDIATAIKNLQTLPNAVLLCDKLSPEAIALCEKLSIKTVQGDFLYRILKDNDAIPNEFPIKLNPPKRMSRRAICFAKSNSKRFFKSGLLLSVYSFFTPYSIYYTIVACLFFSISVFVRVFGYR